MSSPQDGNGNRNDIYFQYTGAPLQEAPTINHLLQQQQQQQLHQNGPICPNPSETGFSIHQGPPKHIMWPNPLLGPPYIQPAAILQNQHQQQQQYNDYLYNLHMQQALTIPQPGPQKETYTVLPVGHGNFLKIYHCTESGENILANEVPQQQQATFQPQFHHAQQQHSSNFHINQSTGPPVQPQFFNNYELFSSGTLLNPQEINISSNEVISNPLPMTPPNYPETQNIFGDQETLNTTNIIINNLGNWSPNLTGESYMKISGVENVPPLKNEEVVKSINIEKSEPEKKLDTDVVQSKTINEPIILSSTAIANEQPKIHLNENLNIKNNKASNSVPVENKKRIVAEVKPMRMTYSDVLSKVNRQDGPMNNPKSSSATSSNNPIKFATANNFSTERKTEKTTQRQFYENDFVQKNVTKRSPTHENKENQQILIPNKMNKKSSNTHNMNSNTNQSNIIITGIKNNTQRSSRTNQKSNYVENDGQTKKRNISKRNDSNSDSNSSCNNNRASRKQSNSDEKDFNGFYNVTEKHNNETKTNATNNNNNINNNNNVSTSTSSSNSNYRKSNKNNSSANNSNHTNNSSFNSSSYQSRSRYSNSNVSYSFSTKRSRAYGSSANSTAAATNRNYELAKKLLKTWGKYMIRALIWFYYLIYDIIVLSCTILYERLTQLSINGYHYSKQLIQDIRNNSNKPSIWFKTNWRRFDNKFSKDSRWAFWRRFFKKKNEPVPDNFKSGRLPTTGEEAMYSLLNCKGKDAYSILGVLHNCPQEQIRKHYKKIAVLVHPDKNKQAGAEEAFKVLQRAFELIGEPESRLAYDKSLVEALQAEKPWSDLHILLSQLQTKIAEAANTVRCSTCSARHPRKVVERPHYAARLCGACKTYHSAKEGDIWAETYCFGFRWKYLALMEGKVFDVTQWAFCQKGALAHLEPNSHLVQYRIVRGAQQQQQEQQQQQQKNRDNKRQQTKNSHTDFPGGRAPWEHANFKHDLPRGDSSFEDFLENLYGQNPKQRQNASNSGSTRRRSRRN